jgi:hypothetical protein
MDYFRKDYILHAIAGFIICLVVSFFAHPMIGLSLAILSGFGKEVYDQIKSKGFDFIDLIYTVLGGALAYILLHIFGSTTVYIPIILFLSYTVISAYIDVEHIKDKDYIEDHTSRIVQRGIVIVLSSFINIWFLLLFPFIFWVFFDATLNVLWGRDIFYIGNTAITDKFFRGNNWLYIGSKILALLISLFLINYIA